MNGIDLDHTPVRPPPPGQTSNFTNPESRSYQLVILISILSFFVILITSLRLYSRLRVTKSFGADDIFGICAAVLTLAYNALVLTLLYYPGGSALGIHLWDVSLRRFLKYQKGSFADAILIQATHITIKIGFFMFYLRLFGTRTYVRYMIWAGTVVLVTFFVVFFILYLAFCLPRAGETFISPSLTKRCSDININLITAGAYVRVITDFYTLLIPIHQLPQLGLSKKRKIGVALIFLTGLLAAGAGLTNLILRSNPKIFDTSDFSWTIVPVYATSLVELNIGLICLSLPVIFILFVGRFNNLSRTLSSWIRRSPRPSPHQSAHSDSREHIAGSDNAPPQLPPVSDDTSLSGMRKFIRNIYRSQLLSFPGRSTVGRDETFAGTLDDLSPDDIDYHVHLKAAQAKESKGLAGEGSQQSLAHEKPHSSRT